MKGIDKIKEFCQSERVKHVHHHGGDGGSIYGLGIIGALFYFLPGSTTITAVLVAIFKSIFWPALVLYKVLTLLNI
jgi:hypothetical protein